MGNDQIQRKILCPDCIIPDLHLYPCYSCLWGSSYTWKTRRQLYVRRETISSIQKRQNSLLPHMIRWWTDKIKMFPPPNVILHTESRFLFPSMIHHSWHNPNIPFQFVWIRNQAQVSIYAYQHSIIIISQWLLGYLEGPQLHFPYFKSHDLDFFFLF